jgi:hypothetical protein
LGLLRTLLRVVVEVSQVCEVVAGKPTRGKPAKRGFWELLYQQRGLSLGLCMRVSFFMSLWVVTFPKQWIHEYNTSSESWVYVNLINERVTCLVHFEVCKLIEMFISLKCGPLQLYSHIQHLRLPKHDSRHTFESAQWAVFLVSWLKIFRKKKWKSI